jgi:muconolactone delta-isomerase
VKFLVIWKLDLSLLSPHVAAAVARMPAYAKPLEQSGQVAGRYHIVGAHGGARLYDVGSNSELERLIALMPIYNFAHYTIYPLADMPETVAAKGGYGTAAQALLRYVLSAPGQTAIGKTGWQPVLPGIPGPARPGADAARFLPSTGLLSVYDGPFRGTGA